MAGLTESWASVPRASDLLPRCFAALLKVSKFCCDEQANHHNGVQQQPARNTSKYLLTH